MVFTFIKRNQLKKNIKKLLESIDRKEFKSYVLDDKEDVDFEKEIVLPLSNQEQEVECDEAADKNNVLSKKLYEQLQQQLIAFEKSDLYLEKNFTITKLATLFNCNPKTVSEFIKENKKQNFNAYINHLRISYFIHKVEEDQEFRRYKLPYIAEVLGYSSLGAFSNSFKGVAGIGPSFYLKNRGEQLKNI